MPNGYSICEPRSGADWEQLGEKLAAVEAEMTAVRQQIGEETTAIEEAERNAAELELQAADSDSAIHALEGQLGENRERTAALETSIEHERKRVEDLEEQASRHRKQLQALTTRAGDLADLSQATLIEVQAAEAKHRQLAGGLADQQRALTALTAHLDQIRSENEQRRAAHLEQLRASAALSSEISTLEGRMSRTEETRERCGNRLAELEAAQDRIEHDIALLTERRDELVGRLNQRTAELAAAKDDLASARRQLAGRQKELASWRERLSGAVERAALLAELEKRHEGVGDGVKEVLQFVRENPEGPFKPVRGLLADLVQVSVEIAPLIEIALGEKAHHFVISAGNVLLDYLAAHGKRLSSRVGFLPLDSTFEPLEEIDLQDQPGVIGRADKFVECSQDISPLIQRLLGDTWLVENLNHAIALRRSLGSQVNFVTLSGDFLGRDGTVVAGKRQAAVGLISRRSELRVLRAQIVDWEQTTDQIRDLVAAMEQQVAVQEQLVAEASNNQQTSSEAVAEQRLRIHAAGQRREQIIDQTKTVEEDFRQAVEQFNSVTQSLSVSRQRLSGSQTSILHAEARMSDNARRIEELDAARQQRMRDAQTAQIELARSEQQLDHLRGQLRRYEQDRDERERTIAEAQEQLADCIVRGQQAENRILAAESEAAELFLYKEQLAVEFAKLADERENLRRQRADIAQQSQRVRSKIRKLEEQSHAKELVAGELRHERSTLESRLREDYSIELANLVHGSLPVQLGGRAEIDAEIADLRRKLTNIGGVNLDALEEIDEMEQRFQSLSTQHLDLSQAKSSLEQIIQRINADSRRLFAETLETVKGHFQQLFSKLFGGGQADIILEDGADILESGIEIVARPPGKEPRSISLLSGGEKTLTCVALLLAIFRSRPSPFCVLDEVDAALDEANIERFVNVLREFLEWTQFIVVTHSKKTMAFANTLYGVTMQESGVSKRVSVRFDDVSETGEISKAAIERSRSESPQGSATEAA